MKHGETLGAPTKNMVERSQEEGEAFSENQRLTTVLCAEQTVGLRPISPCQCGLYPPTMNDWDIKYLPYPTIHGCTPRVDDQEAGPITKVKVNGSWSPKKTGFWVSIDRIHLVRVSTTWQKKL